MGIFSDININNLIEFSNKKLEFICECLFFQVFLSTYYIRSDIKGVSGEFLCTCFIWFDCIEQHPTIEVSEIEFVQCYDGDGSHIIQVSVNAIDLNDLNSF